MIVSSSVMRSAARQFGSFQDGNQVFTCLKLMLWHSNGYPGQQRQHHLITSCKCKFSPESEAWGWGPEMYASNERTTELNNGFESFVSTSNLSSHESKIEANYL